MKMNKDDQLYKAAEINRIICYTHIQFVYVCKIPVKQYLFSWNYSKQTDKKIYLGFRYPLCWCKL